MTRILRTVAIALLLVSATSLSAQDPTKPQDPAKQLDLYKKQLELANQQEHLKQQEQLKQVVVRTFLLQNLSPEDAAKLITPYVDFTPGGGVFLAGNAVRGVTVRGIPAVVARADSLLKANDHAPVTVRLTFQLIAALDSSISVIDPSIAPLDEELRRLFKFRGYKLLSQGVVVAGEWRSTSLTLASGRTELDQYLIEPFIERIDANGKGSVSVRVKLSGIPFMTNSDGRTTGKTILESSFSSPFGQTMVLGSGSAFGGRVAGSALILSVRPEMIRP
jgi:hypothetical protein